ncbi:glycerol-3-phosphate cytidylyltransferase [Lactococcus ileimucosae]|uniref:glycerol-3-phosphate cytidylyltransferase n=1 Tax=Lactococcus ileimucosae TaxID=2941329 RepID=UPI003511E6B1
MKEKVILVAGPFDILHESPIDMLGNARNLGDGRIVMLSTAKFGKNKKDCQDYNIRKGVLEAVQWVDLVVSEQSWKDQRLYVDRFAMGEDWYGKLALLKEDFPELKIMYFPRGKRSSSQIKKDLKYSFKEE